MPDHDFDRIIDRRNSDSIKWNHYDPEVLPMWVADMEFAAPPPVLDALRARVEHGVFGYALKSEALVDEICNWVYKRFHWQVSPPEIVLLPGVITGFNLACHAFADRGEGILLQTPVYPPIWHAPEVTHRTRQAMQLVEGGDGYEVDFDAFEAVANDSSRLFILCNPQNPVGRVFRRDELEHMAELCLRHNLVICSDEIHSDLVFSGHRHLPIASLSPEIARRTVTLMAPSKTFNIAGLECAFAVIQDGNLRQRYERACQGVVPGVNLMGRSAALAAYRHGGEWLSALLKYLEANRDFLSAAVREHLPATRMVKTEGTYLAWLDCRRSGIPGNPAKFFLKQARLGLNDGATFGPGGEGFVRLNFGCPRPLLEDGVQRLQTAWQAVQS